jgi:uncharacterized zinc-type alcohol dehydrogenase-like protein
LRSQPDSLQCSRLHPRRVAAVIRTGYRPELLGRKLAGSLIGGIKETQEMLDFCALHKVYADIELISVQDINQAYDRVVASDVRYRFVIDIASLNE